MTTISDKDRAEAQAIFEVYHGSGVVRTPNDGSVRRWLAVRDHVLASHECPTVPVWRPVTFEEIQPGWEVRVRCDDGSEASWGVAHHRGASGDWCTEAGVLLTLASRDWTYETTAPLPEPEPWPDELVEDVAGAIDHYDGFSNPELARSLLNLLADRGLIERPKAGA